MCITTVEALHTVKTLIMDDIDACCQASMDKNEVTIKLEKDSHPPKSYVVCDNCKYKIEQYEGTD